MSDIVCSHRRVERAVERTSPVRSRRGGDEPARGAIPAAGWRVRRAANELWGGTGPVLLHTPRAARVSPPASSADSSERLAADSVSPMAGRHHGGDADAQYGG